MFRLFDKHQARIYKWVMVFFLAIVSIGMIFVFTPLGGGGDMQGPTNVLARIGDVRITTQDLRTTIDNRLRNSSLGQDPHIIPAIAGTVLDNMVLQQALAMQARKMGLVVTGSELRGALKKLPWLYPKGQFIGMAAYKNVVSQQMGISTQEFEDEIRQSLLIQKIQAVVSNGVSVTPAEVHEAYEQHFMKAKIQYVVFDPSKFLKSVPIKQPALQNYFKAHATHYEQKEQRQVQYVLITPDDVRSKVDITDAAMKQYYMDHLSDYRVPNRVKVAQILFKTTGKTPDQTKKIEKTAEEVLAKIRAGANFGDMAKKYSDDTSASNGGNIGWIVHGQTVKEFEDTAFSLNPGHVSGLVHTSYGIHIIKVLDKQTAHLETFDDVKDAIHAKLLQRQIAAGLQDYANKLYNKFQAKPHQFASIARQAGLQVKQSSLFTYGQTIPDFGSNDAFQNLTFELKQNEIGQPISVPKGTAIIQVTQIVPAHVPKLETVQAMVEEDYRQAQSVTIAHQKAQAFAAQVKKGDFAKVARAGGYDVQESKEFTRQDTVPNLGPGQSIPQAFTLAPGQNSGVLKVEGNDVVIHVVSHTPPVEANFASQKDTIREQLLTQKREIAFEIYRQNLKKELMRSGKLKMNEATMKTFLASYETR
ncbi:MAG: peptidyl-prolyl cis-trans isomerase [Acidobacteriota bacterium]